VISKVPNHVQLPG